jgi:hypothetical protein
MEKMIRLLIENKDMWCPIYRPWMMHVNLQCFALRTRFPELRALMSRDCRNEYIDMYLPLEWDDVIDRESESVRDEIGTPADVTD